MRPPRLSSASIRPLSIVARATLAVFAAFLAIPSPAQAQYPALGSLGPDDAIYRQQQEQLQASYAAVASGGAGPALVIYSWQAKSGVDLFSLAARLNLPYDSLASLNGMDRARAIVPGERVLVPSAPGIFVPERGSSDLDYLLSWRDRAGGESILLNPGRAGAQVLPYRFFRGERFSPEERALFLGLLFRFPLPAAVLTSGFGLRVNPVTGKLAEHQGVDLAAPSGTEVYATREGTVVESGRDSLLGDYLVISHEGDFQTVYGHLSQRLVRLNDHVESGMIIGRVGSTGQSTGPHLHFEVRLHGEARDPASMLPKVKR